MSLCSTKTSDSFKLVHFNKPQVVGFVLREDGCTVCIEDKDDTVEGIVAMCRELTNEITPIEVKFGNMKQAFEFHPGFYPPPLLLHYDYDANKPVENSIIQHIHKLFGQTLPIGLIIEEEQSFDDIPLYEKVMEVHVDCTVTAEIMEYIHKHPDVTVLFLNEKLSVAPEVSEIQNVYIKKAEEFAGTILRSFNARSLFFQDAYCNNEDILAFLNRWKNNSGYQSLVFVSIDSETPLDSDAILSQIETTPYDETTRPATHIHHCPSYYGGSPWETDTKEYRDIRRVDGKLASFSVEENFFEFRVWD
ncbi:hypothetical protein CAEBREN_18012 [Caenorhabditis brenneri]|uniref:F-box associated domain-containing protein n=1 Tax=Caenorhabditis brenneri TaxID=135651 RepID=G0P2U0_CAEBE|nr:hypothetical protein CAEBREN_18012 [Caenorhabditis brenneri]